MNKIILVAINILKRLFKKPSSFLIHILLPVAVSVAMVSIFSSSGDQKLNMILVDESQSQSSQTLVSTIEATGKYKILEVEEQEIKQKIIDGTALFALMIPENFEKLILQESDPTVEVMSIGENEGTGWIRSTVDFQIQNLKDLALASSYDAQTYYSMLDDVKEGEVSVNIERIEDVAMEKGATSQSLGMYLMLLMLSAFTVSNLVIREKKAGTYRRIGMAPVHAKAYVLGNILANVMVMLAQIGLVIFTLTVVVGVNLYMNPLIAYLILMVFALCSISLGMMFVVFSKSADAFGAMLTLVLSPTCMLSGCFWPIEYMPDYMKKIAYITPQRWTLDALKIAQSGGNIPSILPSLCVVICFALVFFLFAVYKAKNEG